ncbi:MAG: hypothetical protein K8F91_10540, partial [Candidatus Obscuribacterales bacterium]|nr:hypothetical protein [Candidatus Obscuribacterales bacterium]
MSIIGDLPVAKLALEGTKITDAGLKALAKAKNLKELNLDKTRLTNTGLTYLKDLKLKRLELNNCQGLSGQALAIIANQWPDIEFIGISYVPFSSNDFQQLVKCKKLRYLLALNSKLNNDDLKLIGTFKNLKWLYLSHGKFDDQALTHLYNLKNLKVMSLHETPSVSPEAVKLLKSKLPSGCELMTDRAKGVGAIDDFSDMIQKSIDGHLEE